jgi:hypothetical protein
VFQPKEGVGNLCLRMPSPGVKVRKLYIRVHSGEPSGGHGRRRPRQCGSAAQTSMTRAPTPTGRRRRRSRTRRHRLTPLVTGARPTRRRARRRLAACWARASVRPHGFRVGRLISTGSQVKAGKPTSRSHRRPAGQGQGGGLGDPFVMGPARGALARNENRERGVGQAHGFDRLTRLLATRIARRLRRIVGPLEAPFGAIVARSGEAGAGADGSTGVGGAVAGTTSAVASPAATLRRVAGAVTDRGGASPSGRSVACRTLKRP